MKMISFILLFFSSVANASGFVLTSGDIEKIRSTMATTSRRLNMIALEQGEAMCTLGANVKDFHCLIGGKVGLGSYTLTDEIADFLDQELAKVQSGDSTEFYLPYPTQSRVTCSISENTGARSYACEFLN